MKKYSTFCFLVYLLLCSGSYALGQSLSGQKVAEAAKNYDSHHIYKQSGSTLFRTVFMKTAQEIPVFTFAYSDASGVIKFQLEEPYSFTDQYYYDINTDDIQTDHISSFSDFSEGFAVVKNTKTGLKGFINTEGKIVIQPQYTLADKFSDGLAYFAIIETCVSGETRPNKMGYIDKTNKQVILLPKQLSELDACCYFSGGEFRNGIAIMSIRQNGFDCNSWGQIVIDRNGKVLNYSGELLDVKNNPIKID